MTEENCDQIIAIEAVRSADALLAELDKPKS
jgi:hypothetical protein